MIKLDCVFNSSDSFILIREHALYPVVTCVAKGVKYYVNELVWNSGVLVGVPCLGKVKND